MVLNVGEGSDDLSLRGQLGDLLELKVTNGAGQGKVAVDTAKVDKTTGGGDTVLLGLELGLVVFGEGLGAALDTKDTSGITGVGLGVQCQSCSGGARACSERLWRKFVDVPQRACCRQSS